MVFIKMSVWNKKEAKRLFQMLPFYNVLIEKPKIKGLKNIELLPELRFYDELNIRKISRGFEWYARSYKVEIVDSKYPLAQLEASKSSIKDLFKDLLDEIKGFKYQITVKVLLIKQKIETQKLLLFISILLLKQLLILNICLINLLKKFYIE